MWITVFSRLKITLTLKKCVIKFHNPDPRLNSSLTFMLKKTALWSGAIDIRVCTLVMSGLYLLLIKKKSMRDFNFKGFDSYV